MGTTHSRNRAKTAGSHLQPASSAVGEAAEISRGRVRRGAKPADLSDPPEAALDLHQLIQREAYFRAEERGFASGRELDDWLEAERAVREVLGLDDPSPKTSGVPVGTSARGPDSR